MNLKLDFHPVRKALRLSLNEMAVLCEIYALSNNSKYGGWCWKSKTNIAETLDLSKRTVITICDTLVEKGYIERSDETRYLKPTDLIRELANESENFMIWFKTDGFEIASAKVKEVLKCFTDGAETAQGGVKNLHSSGEETAPNIIKIYTDDIKKEINKEKSVADLYPTQKKFYKEEIENNAGQPLLEKYREYVNFLFLTNPSNKPIDHILKIKNQMSFDNFREVFKRAGLDMDVIYDKTNILLNTPKYAKGKDFLHLIIIAYIRNERR